MEVQQTSINMRIVSYNCRGLPLDLSLRPTLENLLDDNDNDFVCLQETWLTKQDIGRLNALHNKFHGTGSATVDTGDGPIHGHPSGGVAILWKAEVDAMVTPIDLDIDWMCGIEVRSHSKSFILLCVYMPCANSNPEREQEYLQNLGVIQSVLEELPSTCTYIVGDWNADLASNNHIFTDYMTMFCSETGLTISSLAKLPSDSFTYVSEAWMSTSWLDHCVCSQDAHNSINSIEIMYDLGIGDHIPFSIDIAFSAIPAFVDDVNCVQPKLDWSRISQCDIDCYSTLTEEFLSEIHLPDECLECKNMSCSDSRHIEMLNNCYSNVLDAIQRASKTAFADYLICGNSSHVRPGWSTYCAESHKDARETFLLWRENGRPRQGPIFEAMKLARARFKYDLRYVKRHGERLRKDSLATKLADCNPQSFWKEIRKINASKTPLPNCIDGVSGAENIAAMWRDHFQKLFNCVANDFDCTGLLCSYEDSVCVSPNEVQEAIISLSLNKSTGLDNVSAEHLKFCSIRIVTLLADLMTAFFVHGFIPDSILSVAIVPIIKDKTGKIGAKSNYRPVALASVVSKIIEIVILNRVKNLLSSTCNQFGFKASVGSDYPIYLLKEIIARYHSLNGSIFMCFLDASKAFDRVNHSLLFSKLLKQGLPVYIVRILSYWYAHQFMIVKWAGSCSSRFSVTNGVRQGGILSPYLFNFYVNDLSVRLNNCHTGCVVGSEIINHTMYADDLVIFSPSDAGLCELLNVCELFAAEHDIVYNTSKSAVMIIRNKILHKVDNSAFRFILSKEVIPVVQKYKYLGHFLSDNLRDDYDLARQCRSLYAQGNALKHKFHMCSVPVKLKLFKTFCYSLYTAHLWWNFTVNAMRKVHVAYNDAFRFLMNLSRSCSASGMFANYDVLSFKALLRKLIYKFILRVEGCSNPLIVALRNSDYRMSSKIRKFWQDCLYLFP